MRFVGIEVVRLARDLLDERRLVEQFDNRGDAFSVRIRRVPSAPKRMISKRCMLRWNWLKACAAKEREICADILDEWMIRILDSCIRLEAA